MWIRQDRNSQFTFMHSIMHLRRWIHIVNLDSFRVAGRVARGACDAIYGWQSEAIATPALPPGVMMAPPVAVLATRPLMIDTLHNCRVTWSSLKSSQPNTVTGSQGKFFQPIFSSIGQIKSAAMRGKIQQSNEGGSNRQCTQHNTLGTEPNHSRTSDSILMNCSYCRIAQPKNYM